MDCDLLKDSGIEVCRVAKVTDNLAGEWAKARCQFPQAHILCVLN